jgi:hypothetical protein
MHRIRMSLAFFQKFNWQVEVVAIDPIYYDISIDQLLLENVPDDIKIHYVKAFNKKITSKFGLGSIALRSIYFYRKKVNQLLTNKKFDLIYFSTTQFPVCVLGNCWKNKFKVPYVIDMQDPWFSDYYQNKPKIQRPRKYWLAYNLNKLLEPIALKNVDGLISVSESYIEELKSRYPVIKNIPAITITFGGSKNDFDIALRNESRFYDILLPGFKNIVYIGRGGFDMHAAIVPLFVSLQNFKSNHPHSFNKIKLYFIGTSYAADGKGIPTIAKLAEKYRIEENVIEITDRISYFHTLSILQKSDALFIPGSDDPRYTASKLYPYLLTQKPLLAIIHSKSPANAVLKEYGVKYIYNYNKSQLTTVAVEQFLMNIISAEIKSVVYSPTAVQKYSAENITKRQCELFEAVINSY